MAFLPDCKDIAYTLVQSFSMSIAVCPVSVPGYSVEEAVARLASIPFW